MLIFLFLCWWIRLFCHFSSLPCPFLVLVSTLYMPHKMTWGSVFSYPLGHSCKIDKTVEEFGKCSHHIVTLLRPYFFGTESFFFSSFDTSFLACTPTPTHAIPPRKTNKTHASPTGTSNRNGHSLLRKLCFWFFTGESLTQDFSMKSHSQTFLEPPR